MDRLKGGAFAKMMEVRSKEVRSLEVKLKDAKNKYLAKEKEWGVKEKSLQDKVALLEAKAQEQEESHVVEEAEHKEALTIKVKEAVNLEGETVKQYITGFAEAITQVKFLYSNMDVSPCGYFKEIRDGS